jgi:hypothetical protein
VKPHLYFFSALAVPLAAVLSLKADPASAAPLAAPQTSLVALAVSDGATELEPVQARWMNGGSSDEAATDKRGVSQMFTWTSSKRLTAIGLKTDGFEHKLNTGVIAPQDWVIEIQEIDAERSAGTKVATLQFTLHPRSYKVGQYLLIKPVAPVALKSGKRYGFHLMPKTVVDFQRLYFARTAQGSAELGGGANQTHGDTLQRYGVAPGEYQYDLVFFLYHG